MYNTRNSHGYKRAMRSRLLGHHQPDQATRLLGNMIAVAVATEDAALAKRAVDAESRCAGVTTYGSTGVVRRRTCTYCGESHTSSAKWREPRHSLDFVVQHETRCPDEWLRSFVRSFDPVGLVRLTCDGFALAYLAGVES